jgi:glutamate 5-kinase
MATKLEAAETAARSGAATVVCNGRKKDVLLRLLAGEREGTLFLPGERLTSRKHWLAFTTRPRGELVLDDGAVRAVRERGKSLLPAGVVAVRGRFGIGDPVACVDPAGREIARGLAAYASGEVERIRGLDTRKVAKVLGYSNGNAVVHRDDLVLLDAPTEPRAEPEPSG